MSEYIHIDDAYTCLREREAQWVEQDLAKARTERDQWKRTALVLARELGNSGIAHIEYDRQEGVPND
jgi:hypothetical protein